MKIYLTQDQIASIVSQLGLGDISINTNVSIALNTDQINGRRDDKFIESMVNEMGPHYVDCFYHVYVTSQMNLSIVADRFNEILNNKINPPINETEVYEIIYLGHELTVANSSF